MLFSDTFDTTYALSSAFLLLIFGMLIVLVNCDIQRFMKSHPLVIHLLGLTAFFFLFTILDPNNKQPLSVVYFKTVLVYILFILMTKSKWYFVAPVLILLLIDQSVKKHVAIKKANNSDITIIEKRQKEISKYLNLVIIVMIIMGSIDYLIIQKNEYKDKFSLYKFFFYPATTCKQI